jgi:hypothetical protein
MSFPDFATITLTDDWGHTRFKFVKEKADSQWSVASDPSSLKSLQYMRYARDFPPDPIVRLPDGRERLNVPGRPLPWDAATWSVLDRLHASGYVKLTDRELRFAVDSVQ